MPLRRRARLLCAGLPVVLAPLAVFLPRYLGGPTVAHTAATCFYVIPPGPVPWGGATVCTPAAPQAN